ncbi:MAG: hypothetical protein BZ136_08810 [Methanosphaera sp. rholeuAM74]|nr:MAG: hypothetical protein BZ136_08810 [Methanosphaera sp. rholeuAM74]
MKKIMFGVICALILTCGLSVAIAVDLTSHEFSNFKMDVPGNSNFNESTHMNGKDVLENAVANNGGSISFDELDSNPAYCHPEWRDDVNNFTVEYIDCSEDSLSSYSNAMKQLYADSSFKEDSGNIHIYDMSKVNGEGTFSVCRENDGKGIVIISGKDLDLLKQMGESITFK